MIFILKNTVFMVENLNNQLKACTHGAICIRVQILHICKISYEYKSLHVYAFTHVCKICTYAKVGKFEPASDQVQISFCVYANFAYMQI